MQLSARPPQGATSVPALRRAVAVLDYLSGPGPAPNMTDLARALDMPKSTAHGLLIAMEEMGLVRRAPNGTLRIGIHPMTWANGFLAQTNLSSCFNEYFTAHRDLARFTVTMSVLEGAEVVYIACAQADQPLGVTFRIGMRLPAPFTATGKVLLAALPENERRQRFAAGFPDPLTPRSLKSLSELETELLALHDDGVSIDDGQVREGMICLGSAIHDHTGTTIAGIALSLTRIEATPEMVHMVGSKLREAAIAISAGLGYGGPAQRQAR